MIYLETNSTHAGYNLAFEEYVFERLDAEKSYLILWQNDNTIVVGKHQNTAHEINGAFVNEHNIRVVRRLSGGGAVYHDLGNLNYTIIDRQTGGLDFTLLTKPVLSALKNMGVNAELSGRNDLTIDGRKFSGNAQYAKHGRVMHHGTLMFSSDLDVLSNALRPPEGKLESKGVKSIHSRVTNIGEHTDMTMEDFKRLLLSELFPDGVTGLVPSNAQRMEIEKLQREKYDTWDWTYGQSPPYSHRFAKRFPFGGVELLIEVKSGLITSARIFGDFFGKTDISGLERALINAKPTPEGVGEVLRGIDVGEYISGMTKEDFMGLIIDN